MVQALCIRSCYDSSSGTYYEKDRSFIVDETTLEKRDLARYFKLDKEAEKPGKKAKE